ncbi:hypothetical protein BKA70DRAFT_94336 [Coprinopsis sp. MPI-PUGE-AT-0042]|nr:hypothetical protein BKA70DRAFT_94336 [Coprinopsis sp. MPI-PUGE-AT-0042]
MLVVFGDSYSSSHLSENGGCVPWVQHLGKTSAALEKIKLENYAFPGANAEDDLESQIGLFLLAFKGDNAMLPANPSTLCYIFWLGINDCGRTSDEDELDAIVEKIFDAAHDLYVKAKARRFLFVDVPPIDRSPSGLPNASEFRARVAAWNESLKSRVDEFSEETPNATVTTFSAHELLTEILDSPEDHGFTEEDVEEEGGSVWLDDLHLTTEVHEIIAKRLGEVIRNMLNLEE